jgi:hypothetical protein
MDENPTTGKSRFVAMPDGVQNELPSGIALDLLLIEVRKNLRFDADPKPFDLPWATGYAAVQLNEDGYSDGSAWWLATEASVNDCLECLPEDDCPS